MQHPAEIIIPTILLILTGLGIMALLLAMFLIVNTIEAILTQQVRQIGMLKAIGARRMQIMGLYFGMVLIFGVLALLIAVPLGTGGALAFTRFMTSQLNVDITSFNLPAYVLVFKVVASLLLPLLVAIGPIRAAARVTVREAISNEGPDTSSADGGLINRLVERVRGLPRPLLLSLRNTFRRKGRLMRTLVVLTLGGAIFVSVLTVRASLYTSLDDTMATKHYDIEMRLARPYRHAEVVQRVQQVPGVAGIEGWRTSRVYPLRADGSEGEYINLYAMPADTELLDLDMYAGRWLATSDRRAIVLSSTFLNKEPDAGIGDELVLKIEGEEYSWFIVGISREFASPVNPAIGYVTYDGFAHAVGGMGEVNSLQVVTERHAPEFQQQVVQGLEEYTDRANIQVRLIRSTYEDQLLLYERFNILTAVLSIMAALIGIVGGLGLMGTMSINVIERTKEIGIMRAIGASDGTVQQIVISEGIVIGLLSWVFGTLLSLPISFLMSRQIGIQLLNRPLSYEYALYAVGLWLLVVLMVATVASYLPARNASRLTVREVLSYE
jgi:putative ABC transport system permease protein